MAGPDLPPEEHPELDPAQDAALRGMTSSGLEDEHPPRIHADLPPVDPNYRQSDVNARIDRLLREAPPRHRAQTLFPFLFIRAVPGDRGGGRPLWPPIPCWESCDIHLLPAAVAGGFDFSKTVLHPVAGDTYRVFVHVWNLGRFAAYGARLRAWWIEPGFFNGTNDPRYTPHFIGGTYFDLGDRDSGQSHHLIEVRPSWIVQMNQPAHECLIAVVDCATDPWDGSIDANRRRHVAQRNLDLVGGSEDLAPVVAQLAAMFGAGQQLLVASSSVDGVDLTGAVKRGVSSRRDAPRGWDHTALTTGTENRPIAAVRPGPDGLRFYPLDGVRGLPDPRVPLEGGAPVEGELGQALPELLRRALGVPSLSGANVAVAITGRPDRPGLLRFVLTDRGGRNGGYSVLTAPRV
jgi:hypothetical protein